MTKDERKKYLTEIATSITGQALKEEIQEKINSYGQNVIKSGNSFEEVLGYRIAIKLWEEFLRELSVLGKKKTKKDLNEYE